MKLFAAIRADVRRPWDLWTSILLVACFVLLAIEKLCSSRTTLAPEGSAVRVCVWTANLLLASSVGAALSLLRRGVARAVPAFLLLLLISLGWLEILTALMWLPFAAVEIVHRLLSG